MGYSGINSLPQPNQTSPRQLVIPDVDEPFLPLPPSTLFVDPHQSRCANFSHYLRSSSILRRPRAVIESLFDNLQQRQTSLPPGAASHSCLGSALRMSLEALVCSTSLCHYDRPYRHCVTKGIYWGPGGVLRLHASGTRPWSTGSS